MQERILLHEDVAGYERASSWTKLSGTRCWPPYIENQVYFKPYARASKCPLYLMSRKRVKKLREWQKRKRKERKWEKNNKDKGLLFHWHWQKAIEGNVNGRTWRGIDRRGGKKEKKERKEERCPSDARVCRTQKNLIVLLCLALIDPRVYWWLRADACICTRVYPYHPVL